jgi:sarcosine oxidase subunit beta
MALGALGIKTRVIDMHPSPGQGENKHAIGDLSAIAGNIRELGKTIR